MKERHQHFTPTPILPVRDLEEAAEFYRSLGFEVANYDLTYAFVIFDGHEAMHLRSVPNLDPSLNETSAYIHVADADATRAALGTDRGVGNVEDRPWGMREFSINDPSGNTIRIGHQIAGTDVEDIAPV